MTSPREADAERDGESADVTSAAQGATNGAPATIPTRVGADGRPEAERIGRFVVRGTLGKGGMGTVFEAYDETLDRKVAIKRLSWELSGDDEAMEALQQRMLREAQALARLSHPNVVQVYDAGEQDGQLYIAMELVEGQTLTQWQTTRRPWREVLDAYLGAARGLAAAHARDIIHRDFKPSNCLIDERGRVKVLDFGLARGVGSTDGEGLGLVGPNASGSSSVIEPLALGEAKRGPAKPDLAELDPAKLAELGPPEPNRSSQSNGSMLAMQLTQTGAVLGTPAYMAPEQALRKPTDARSDQFSFCVALFEGLYGKRPFPKNPGIAVMLGVEPRVISVPPELPAIPKWLRRALDRGMSAKKEDRFASMDELIEALREDERRRRRFTRIGLGAIGLAMVTALLFTTQDDDPCQQVRQDTMPGWSTEDRAAVQGALSRTSVDGAWAPTATALDDYAQAWTEAQVEACEQTHVKNVASEGLLDRRVACLEQRAIRVQATVALLTEADDRMATQAAQLVHSLPPIDPCLDAEQLGDDPGRLPEALAEPAEEIRRRIARSWALGVAGRGAEGLDVADRAVTEAMELGEDGWPLLAEAWHNRGRLHMMARRLSEAHRDLEGAMRLAERHDPALTFDALHDLALVAELEEDRSAFEAWLAVIRSKLQGTSESGRDWARRYHLEGMYALMLHDHARATEAFADAVRLYSHLEAKLPLEHGRALVALGEAEREQGHYDEAERHLGEAQELADAAGLRPLRADVDHARGWVEYGRGRYEHAERWLRRALEIRVAIGGPTGAITIPTRVLLARVLEDEGEFEAAHAMLVDAHECLDPSTPSPQRQQVLTLLARQARQQGRWHDALTLYQQQQQELESTASPDPVDRAQLMSNMGACLGHLGTLEEARKRYEQALAILLLHLPSEDDARFMHPYLGLGQVLAAQGDLQGALEPTKRALEIHELTREDPDTGAQARWWLGQLLVDTATSPSERHEGFAHVCTAYEQFRGWGKTPVAEKIAAYLETEGVRCSDVRGDDFPIELNPHPQ